jgi:hypothetical protein
MSRLDTKETSRWSFKEPLRRAPYESRLRNDHSLRHSRHCECEIALTAQSGPPIFEYHRPRRGALLPLARTRIKVRRCCTLAINGDDSQETSRATARWPRTPRCASGDPHPWPFVAIVTLCRQISPLMGVDRRRVLLVELRLVMSREGNGSESNAYPSRVLPCTGVRNRGRHLVSLPRFPRSD